MSRMRNGNGHYAHHANSVRRKIRGSRARMQDMRFYEATQDQAHLTVKSNEPHGRAVGSRITPCILRITHGYPGTSWVLSCFPHFHA
jgi:hypothetical protein